MRRPAGVIVVCVVLGIAALLLACATLFSIAMIFVAGNMPMGDAAAGRPQASPEVLRFIFAAGAAFYGVLAGWAIATLVGLVKMKQWARYSVIVIGSGLALIGFFAAAVTAIVPTVVPPNASSTMSPEQTAAMLHGVMLVTAGLEMCIAMVGVWWIIYFLLRSTREVFAAAAAGTMRMVPASAPDVLQFRTATYPSADENLGLAEPVVAAPVTVSEPGRPVVVTVIAWLCIAGGAFTALCGLVNVPLFVFGMVLSGWASHAYMLVFGGVSVGAGYGLLRLKMWGLYLAYGMNSFGMINGSLMLFPSYQVRMFAYQHQLQHTTWMGMPMAAQTFDDHTLGLLMIPGVGLGLIVCLAVIFLLARNRSAFERADAAAS